MKEPIRSIITNCQWCNIYVEVPLSAKCFTCPKCGEHQQFDAQENNEKLKFLMKKVFGENSGKPENN